MIDTLFGSKTRVKLLHLFLNNVDKSFYVREITRIVDEQINSVRRELSNMLTVGIITSDTSDNKLYYKVSKDYEHFAALRAIFSQEEFVPKSDDDAKELARKLSKEKVEKKNVGLHAIQGGWKVAVRQLPGVRIVIAAGSFVSNSTTNLDLLIVSDLPARNMRKLLAAIEKQEGRELNYSVLPYDEFYYRWSIRDKFITEILNSTHQVVVDVDNVLKG